MSLAKFLNEKEIVNNRITDYCNHVTNLAKYIQGSPTFTTYYSKNYKASTEDVGLKAVHEIVGMESPIKYDKVLDFPIYNVGEMPVEVSTDEEEMGTDTSIEGEGVILPECGIVPQVDDIFVISYDQRKLPFRVVDVQYSDFTTTNLYKINFTFTRWNLEILEEHQIANEYYTRYDEIGKNNGVIVLEKSIATMINNLQEKKDEIMKYYVKLFYNKDLNTFILNEVDGALIYDNLLMEFIRLHSIFIEKKTYMKNIRIEPLIQFDRMSYHLYEDSIFNDIDNNRYRAWALNPQYMTMQILDNTNPVTIFGVYQYNYPVVHNMMLSKEKVDPNSRILELDDRVKRYMLFLKDMPILDEDQSKKETELKDLVEDFLDYSFSSYNIKNYYNVPMVIVLIDKICENLEALG